MIGSGIGGMTTAVLMSKVGKKVLILEQHDQAGGCCHTFIDKGYEFDVGIHYIGEISKGEINRTLVDQITDGQLGKLVRNFDYERAKPAAFESRFFKELRCRLLNKQSSRIVKE